MRLRLKYDVVLITGDRITGTTPVTFKRRTSRKKKLADLNTLVTQIREVYSRCQADDDVTGHIRLGDWNFDANNITALNITPQRLTPFGWKEVD